MIVWNISFPLVQDALIADDVKFNNTLKEKKKPIKRRRNEIKLEKKRLIEEEYNNEAHEQRYKWLMHLLKSKFYSSYLINKIEDSRKKKVSRRQTSVLSLTMRMYHRQRKAAVEYNKNMDLQTWAARFGLSNIIQLQRQSKSMLNKFLTDKETSTGHKGKDEFERKRDRGGIIHRLRHWTGTKSSCRQHHFIQYLFTLFI